MSLATTCPHCYTTFKVANDQLKLQTGLVRCGVCQQIFNGIDHLVEADSQLIAPVAGQMNVQPVQPPFTQQVEVSHPDFLQEKEQPLPTVSFTDSDEPEEVIILKPESEADAVDRMQIDLPAQHAVDSDKTQEKIPSHSEKKSGINKSDASDNDELEQLSFIRQADTKKRISLLFFTGVIFLLLLLAGQATYLLRNYIAAFYPPAKKALATLCVYAHCQIQLPAHINALGYEAVELHSLPREKTFELSLLMRNQSVLTQAWPHIELTLQNALKQPVLIRVFTPADYLSDPGNISHGFSGHQEQAVNLYFEVDQVKASDYSVAIFYP